MKCIAGHFGLKPQVFTSWLTVLANLRNMCCHHARIWNRDFMLTPAEPRKMSNAWIDTSKIDKKRIFYRLCIIRYFLASVSPNNNFNEKIVDLLALFPSIDIAAMGFCRSWQRECLWSWFALFMPILGLKSPFGDFKPYFCFNLSHSILFGCIIFAFGIQ